MVLVSIFLLVLAQQHNTEINKLWAYVTEKDAAKFTTTFVLPSFEMTNATSFFILTLNI
jgi:ferritin